MPMSKKYGQVPSIVLIAFGVGFLLLAYPAIWGWTTSWANEIALEEYGKPLEDLNYPQTYLVTECGPALARFVTLFIGVLPIFFGWLRWGE